MDELLSAVYRQDAGRLRTLLAGGIDPNVVDGDGRTPLMHAVLCDEAGVEVVNTLLAQGAEPNRKDAGQEWTALHFAAQERLADLVAALLEGGAKVDATDVFGNTPLFRAVFAAQGNNQAVAALLEAGADPDRVNRHGNSPRSLAGSIANHDVESVFSGR